jgi:hypothetical protein
LASWEERAFFGKRVSVGSNEIEAARMPDLSVVGFVIKL